MADSSDESGWLQRIKDGARSTIDRAVGAATRQLPDIERHLQSLAPRLLEADNVDQLQDALSLVAKAVYGLGFTIDDRARLLFELFDWIERRHGRRPIVHALGRHNPLLDEAFLTFVNQVGGVASPDDRRREAAERAIASYREHGRRQVLRLLAHLAALESDQPPPSSDRALADYVRNSPLPDRFDALVDIVADTSADSSDDGGTDTDETPPSGWTEDVKRGVGDLVKRDPTIGALIESAGPAFDPQMRFLTASLLFATQAFMTRSAIEALPEMAEQSGLQSDDDVIDI